MGRHGLTAAGRSGYSRPATTPASATSASAVPAARPPVSRPPGAAPARPIERIDPDAPIERIDPEDPIDRIEPDDPIDSADATENADPNDSAEPADAADSAEPTDRHDSTDHREPDDSDARPTSADTTGAARNTAPRSCMFDPPGGNACGVSSRGTDTTAGEGAPAGRHRAPRAPASTLERRLAAAVVRRLPHPLRVDPRLRAALAHRYVDAGRGPVVQTTMRAGHRLVLDLRSESQRDAYFTGRFDEPLVRAVRALALGPGSVDLDIGANVGLWTVPLAVRAAGRGRSVVAFEPVPANVARLRANVALNGLDEVVTIHPFALSDRPGVARISLREDFRAGATSGNAALVIDDGLDARYRTIEVRLRCLDDVASSFPGPVAIVKIDVEGHEDHVLRGGRRMIAADRPVIVAEWNPAYHRRRGTDPTERLHTAMAGLGYRSVRREGDGWIAGDRFHSPRDIDNLVMCPHERTREVLGALSRSHRA